MKKRALITGVANERSLAWAIAQQLHSQGYELAFCYGMERLERKVRKLAEPLESPLIEKCDVTDDAAMDSFFSKVHDVWPDGFDVLIHSIAYAEMSDLRGRFVDVSRKGFQTALEVSAYSLVSFAKRAEPLLEKKQGAIIALTYHGSQKVVPGYGIMGVAKAALESSVRYLAYDLGPKKIRINTISAGAVRTLSSAAIPKFREKLEFAAKKAPLQENILPEDVGHLATFLAGPGGKHITGSCFYVDSGIHIMA